MTSIPNKIKRANIFAANITRSFALLPALFFGKNCCVYIYTTFEIITSGFLTISLVLNAVP